MSKEITETKKKIIDALEGKKEYKVIYKFSDVIETIKAGNKEEAEQIADNRLWSKHTPMKETFCYETEVDEIK